MNFVVGCQLQKNPPFKLPFQHKASPLGRGKSHYTHTLRWHTQAQRRVQRQICPIRSSLIQHAHTYSRDALIRKFEAPWQPPPSAPLFLAGKWKSWLYLEHFFLFRCFPDVLYCQGEHSEQWPVCWGGCDQSVFGHIIIFSLSSVLFALKLHHHSLFTQWENQSYLVMPLTLCAGLHENVILSKTKAERVVSIGME